MLNARAPGFDDMLEHGALPLQRPLVDAGSRPEDETEHAGGRYDQGQDDGQ
ncbi:hypothetical protein D3C72_2507030 [compost metagenome]